MNLFSNSIHVKQMHLAEHELSSFIAAVTKLYGPEQAGLAAEDWLDESELMDSPPRSATRNLPRGHDRRFGSISKSGNVRPASPPVARPMDA